MFYFKDNRMKNLWNKYFVCAILIATCSVNMLKADFPDQYNVVWSSQSKNSSESMPCGGHDIGLNVWVEDGDVLFYMQRSGSLAETNEYLKLGRVRLKLDPNPFALPEGQFRQELKLRQGYVEIYGKSKLQNGQPAEATVRVWVETNRPIIHVEVDSSEPIIAKAAYENWRLEDECIPNDNRRRSFFTLHEYPGKVTLKKDTIFRDGNGVVFYHRNPDEKLVPDKLIRIQGLEDYKDQIIDDLKGRTFGGKMLGEDFIAAGQTEGKYQTASYKGWNIVSRKPAKKHHLRIVTHIAQTENGEQWRKGLDELVDDSNSDLETSRKLTQNWWAEFWDRSRIVISPGEADPDSKAWRVGRNYNLFRYQLGCNAYGEYPSKFNGGNFTFDSNLVGSRFNQGFGPDWRNWGGGVFTAQNQRLLHWPMLKAGDFDLIIPHFELYHKALGGAKARVQKHFGHDGAVYSEYIGVPGIALGAGWGWESGPRGRGKEIPFGDPRADGTRAYNDLVEQGVMANNAIGYHYESQLQTAYMILEYHRFTGADISRYIPFIENAVIFFDEHYRLRQKMRSGQELDDNGYLVIFPSKACETYRGATNPTDVIAGMNACIDEILKLEDGKLKLRDKAYYKGLQKTIPPFSYDTVDGARVIQPAEKWKMYRNAEIPQLYPLFPYNRFALGKDDMQVFRDTYAKGTFRKGNIVSWHQDGIFFARMGQTDKAVDYNFRKLDDSNRRFPTFWGPGHDWVPDHNWGGSGMIGLQEMLLQTIGDKIYMLPAWPKDVDADFKLHAPKNTVIEAKVRSGEITFLEVTPSSRRKDVVLPE